MPLLSSLLLSGPRICPTPIGALSLRRAGVLTFAPFPPVNPILSLILSSLTILSIAATITLAYLGEGRNWPWLGRGLDWCFGVAMVGVLGQLAISVHDVLRHIALSHS